MNHIRYSLSHATNPRSRTPATAANLPPPTFSVAVLPGARGDASSRVVVVVVVPRDVHACPCPSTSAFIVDVYDNGNDGENYYDNDDDVTIHHHKLQHHYYCKQNGGHET